MVIIFGAQTVLLSATAGSEIDHILGSLSNQDYKGKKKVIFAAKQRQLYDYKVKLFYEHRKTNFSFSCS